MDKYKLLDIFNASKDEATNVAISDVLPKVIKKYGNCIVGESIAEIAGNVVGAVSPKINGIRLSYKYNRLERNINIMFSKLVDRADELEERLELIQSEEYVKNLTEMLLDQIVDEIQVQKVKYQVNGYINIITSDNQNEDMALIFFKTLAQLSDLDIRVLSMYSRESEETAYDIVEKANISYEQLRFVKEKLERFGLLQSRNEKIADDNLETIVKYLQAVEKDNKKRSPKGVKIPKLKKVSLSDTYRITKLGRDYLVYISNGEEKKEN